MTKQEMIITIKQLELHYPCGEPLAEVYDKVIEFLQDCLNEESVELRRINIEMTAKEKLGKQLLRESDKLKDEYLLERARESRNER